MRLTFTPTIAGDVIRLRLRPEVSTLDYTNGIVLSGFRIPALNTRRAETDVELRDGQSFAIAGLLNNLTQTDRQGHPAAGPAADHRRAVHEPGPRAEQTELMVLVTPRLVRPSTPTRCRPCRCGRAHSSARPMRRTRAYPVPTRIARADRRAAAPHP